MNMALISILFFLAVILLGAFRKTNVGVLAFGIGMLAVRVCSATGEFSLTDTTLVKAVSSSTFVMLAGITLLFAVINSTGALELLAKKIVSLAKNHIWVIPIAVYAAGYIIAGVGPGAIPATAIIPGLAVSIAVQVGYNPVMLAVIGILGLCAGRMTPITPEAAIIQGAASSAGVEGVMPAILVCQTLLTIIYAIIIFFFYKGHHVNSLPENVQLVKAEKFNGKQIVSLLTIPALLVLLIFFNANTGIAAFFLAGILLVFGIADDGKCIKAIPWNTILMVLGVGAILEVVKQTGGIDMMINGLSAVMTSKTATPLMGISAGLLSTVSSALGVVFPTMMPMAKGIADTLGNGANAVAIMAAIGAGGSLAGLSPLSGGGAMVLAALGANDPTFSKEKENKIFVELLGIGFGSLLAIALVSAILYNPIVSMFGF
jgi:di/tricarboxylate transporter